MIASTLPVLKATPLLADSGSLTLDAAGLALAQIATTKRAEVLPLAGLFSDLWNMPRKQARIHLYQLIQLQDACQACAANIFDSPEAGLASGFFLFYPIIRRTTRGGSLLPTSSNFFLTYWATPCTFGEKKGAMMRPHERKARPLHQGRTDREMLAAIHSELILK